LNGAHQLLLYADDVNILRENINTIEGKLEGLLEVNKAVGLEVNAEKTKHVFIFRHQSAREITFC
jgi:hypothetical protein